MLIFGEEEEPKNGLGRRGWERGTCGLGDREYGRQWSKAERSSHSQRGLRGVQMLMTYLVILNILRSRRARKTLIPNDVPGLKIAQTTSKILPTVT